MEEQENASIDEIVWVHDIEKKTIFYKEPESTSKEQLTKNFKRIKELARPMGPFYLILDLTIAKRPTAEIRQHILDQFKLIDKKLAHMAIFTGKNFIVNMAATFVMKKTGLKSYTIHKTLLEAEKALEKVRK